MIFLIGILPSCGDENITNPNEDKVTFEKTGLDGKIVNEIKSSGDLLFALTNSGLYKKSLGNSSEWFSLNLDDKDVIGLQIRSNGDLLVAWNALPGEIPASGLLLSTDEGASWENLENNFGGDESEPFSSFYADSNDESLIYAGGNGVLAKSVDGGVTWIPVWGEWAMLANGLDEISINPNNAQELWFGGQGGIENGYLIKKSDAEEVTWDNLVPNPTVVKDITFNPANSDSVLVGFEGALLRTYDSGQNWETLIESEDNRFFFGNAFRPDNTQVIYSGGWLKFFDDPQELVLYISENGGTDWEEYKYDNEDFGGIVSMKLIEKENKDELYIGLYKGGVYKVTIVH